MFVIKENFAHRAEIRTLEHTAEQTAEKCFLGFADNLHETTIENLRSDYQDYADSEEIPCSFEEFNGIEENELMGARLFDVWNGSDTNRIFAYRDEPDWNEMLEYRYGTVTSPRCAEAKYFIAEV